MLQRVRPAYVLCLPQIAARLHILRAKLFKPWLAPPLGARKSSMRTSSSGLPLSSSFESLQTENGDLPPLGTSLVPVLSPAVFGSHRQYNNFKTPAGDSGNPPRTIEQSFQLVTCTFKTRSRILPHIGVLAQTKAIPSAMPALAISLSRTSVSLHVRIHAPRNLSSRARANSSHLTGLSVLKPMSFAK
ncbi:hypothetical protein B0H11DRAFT_1904113 [Mycena galericulata]|nr:hypothetical protein B0H11DRAFT_1904113 [Mycena galericulata]